MSNDSAARGFPSRLPRHNFAGDDKNPGFEHPVIAMQREYLQLEKYLQEQEMMISNQLAQNPVLFSPETPLPSIDGRQDHTEQPMHVYPTNLSFNNHTLGPSGGDNVLGNASMSIPSTGPYVNSNSYSMFYMNVSHNADAYPRLELPSAMAAAGFGSSTSVIKPSPAATNVAIINPVGEQSAAASSNINMRNADEITNGGLDDLKLSTEKKRRKVKVDPVVKQCKCKKTRCLKLYCECFANGLYCDSSCTCQGCHNRPQYEHEVMETRLQIESRDNLGTTQFKPLSSTTLKHKKGCKCKKTQCLKRYCDCYQAGIGCSDACGCEGCQNLYGCKRENDTSKNVPGEENATIDNGTQQSSLVEKSVASSKAFLRPNEASSSQNLTSPLAPPPQLQSLNYIKDGSKSQSPPDSDLSFIPRPQYLMMAPGYSYVGRDVVGVPPALPPRHLCPGEAELDDGDLGNLQNPHQDWTNNSRTTSSSLQWNYSLISRSKRHQGADLHGKFSDIMQGNTPDIVVEDHRLSVADPNI